MNLHTINTPENHDVSVGVIRSTCRRGVKWTEVKIGDQIELTLGPSDTERNPFGTGEVIGYDVLRFRDLNEKRHVFTNHSLNSNTSQEALFAAMQRAYGPEFSYEDVVTVLFYRRIA
jgi:hypothetical protein